MLYLSDASLAYEVPVIFLIPTALEFITGYGYLKLRKARLWDYSDKPFNVMGIVCLEFSVYWFSLSLLYYFATPRLFNP